MLHDLLGKKSGGCVNKGTSMKHKPYCQQSPILTIITFLQVILIVKNLSKFDMKMFNKPLHIIFHI